MEAGTIAAWKVKEGDSFGPGDSLCSIETDKATMDFEAQDEGIVAKILAQAGTQEVKCGEPILITVTSEDDVAAFANYSASAAPPPATAAPVPEPIAPVAAAAAPPPDAPAPVSASQSGGRVVASPLAYLLAKELGHDISAIAGTGPGGRIIAADVKEYVPAVATSIKVEAAAAAAAVAPPVSATTAAPAQAALATAQPISGAGYTDFPLSESAREIAARLTMSKQRVPHYYLTVDINMDKMLDLRSTLNAGIGEKGPQLGVYELVLKAAAVSMKTVPSVNASWMDSVVRVYDSVDINVVVGNGDALFTPVIRDCGSLGVKSISEALSKAVASLEGDAEPVGSDFSALGTFTVMNLGMYGIKSCAPIIREPQSCALALGAIENRIVPNDDDKSEEIYKQCTMMTVTLSCDHRVVDGAVGAQWLSAFKAHIENPTTLLL